MQYRCETVVPQRMAEMEQAILERNFKAFARLTMQVREKGERGREGYQLSTRVTNKLHV